MSVIDSEYLHIMQHLLWMVPLLYNFNVFSGRRLPARAVVWFAKDIRNADLGIHSDHCIPMDFVTHIYLLSGFI